MIDDREPLKKIEIIAPEVVCYPEERARIAAIQRQIQELWHGFPGSSVIDWAVSKELLHIGDVVMAEVSPTYRCSEACEGCPDSIIQLREAIRRGTKPRIEVRADRSTMAERIDLLYNLGVRHFMMIGGTVDGLEDTRWLMDKILSLEGCRASWFSDGIMQTNEDGARSPEYAKNIQQAWFSASATHVSMDYAFDGNVVGTDVVLPIKRGRVAKYQDHPDYSRVFKSQYGAVFARHLIEDHARRVVINLTLSPINIDQVSPVYAQVAQLQQYAQAINSPTEVLFTFSPLIWRPHQARGDNPNHARASAALRLAHGELVNPIFSNILQQEYERIKNGRPRLLANSSGYTALMAAS
jgi:hypothetical protein